MAYPTTPLSAGPEIKARNLLKSRQSTIGLHDVFQPAVKLLGSHARRSGLWQPQNDDLEAEVATKKKMADASQMEEKERSIYVMSAEPKL